MRCSRIAERVQERLRVQRRARASERVCESEWGGLGGREEGREGGRERLNEPPSYLTSTKALLDQIRAPLLAVVCVFCASFNKKNRFFYVQTFFPYMLYNMYFKLFKAQF